MALDTHLSSEVWESVVLKNARITICLRVKKPTQLKDHLGQSSIDPVFLIVMNVRFSLDKTENVRFVSF